MQRILGIVIIVLVLVAGAVYTGSRYLVSRLDGSGGVQAPQDNLTAFESTHIGLHFTYPNTYIATSTHEGTAEREWHVITIMDAHDAANIPPGGEGPPAITVRDIPNDEGLSLEAWVKGDARSNWKLATDPGGLGSTTVGGQPGLAYKHSGLYETSAVAVAHGGKIYLFEGQWLTPDDQIRKDFEALLNSVEFI